MSHDAGVTATELYTHLHMLRCRTVLYSPSVDLPQRDKDRLMVMSLGGQDLFGPNAQKVQEWKKDTEEEQVKMISRVFEERQNRDKATREKPSSSSVQPPRSLSLQSPLDSLHPPNPGIPISDLRAIPFEGIQTSSRPTEPVLLTLPKDILMSRTKSLSRNSPVQVAATSPQDRPPPGKTRTKARNNIVPSPRKGGAEEEAINKDRMGSLPVGGGSFRFTSHAGQNFSLSFPK